MKYYAVTEDPNELLHYGRLGMKWGQHIFIGSKSLAYKNAIGKLRNSKNNTVKSSVKNTVKNVKSVIKKSRVQHAINKQRRQEHKFNNAVEKAQRRIALTENYNVADKLNNYAKAASQANRREQKISKIESKKDRKYFRNEKKMDKYMQEAREGRLKYGKLSEEQVDRITQRLAIERSARQLGNTEKASFRKRLKEATQEGILQGVTQGTAAGMREIAIDKVQNRLRNKRAMDKANRNEAHRAKEATRIKNKRTHKEMREDLAQEAYKSQIEAGENIFQRSRVLHPFTNDGQKIQKAELYKQLHQEKIEQNTRVGKALDEYKLEKHNQKLLQDAQDAKTKRLLEDYDTKYLDAGGKDFDPKKIGATATETINERGRRLNEYKQISGARDRAAYDKLVEERKAEDLNEAKRNAKEEADVDYQRDLKQWRDDLSYDNSQRQQYKQDMDNWKTAKLTDPNAIKPTRPKYRNTPKPDYNKIFEDAMDRYKPKTYIDYETYVRQKAIGLPDPFNNNNGNNGKKGKKGGNGKK